jgi:histidyl-tRNA synthetase
VPACGFSIGLERTKLALERHAALPTTARTVQAVVVPVEAADHAAAIHAAQALRARGVRVELDLRHRGPRGALRHASREGIPLAVVIGERERQTDTVVLRDLAAEQQRSLPLAELPDAALRVLSAECQEP